MRALKFYDKAGTGFEFYMDYETQSIMLHIDQEDGSANASPLELDEEDIDDIIISLVELKNELVSLRNVGNN